MLDRGIEQFVLDRDVFDRILSAIEVRVVPLTDVQPVDFKIMALTLAEKHIENLNLGAGRGLAAALMRRGVFGLSRCVLSIDSDIVVANGGRESD